MEKCYYREIIVNVVVKKNILNTIDSQHINNSYTSVVI